MAEEKDPTADVEFLSEVLYDADGNITTDNSKAVTGQVSYRLPSGEVIHSRLVSNKAPKAVK